MKLCIFCCSQGRFFCHAGLFAGTFLLSRWVVRRDVTGRFAGTFLLSRYEPGRDKGTLLVTEEASLITILLLCIPMFLYQLPETPNFQSGYYQNR